MTSKQKYITGIGIVSVIFAVMIIWALSGKNVTDRRSQDGAGSKSAAASNIKLKVLDITERSYDNKPAIAVLLSTPLDSRKRYDSYLTVEKIHKAQFNKVKGSWVLSKNGRVLYFPHVDPVSKYVVKVRRGLPAANKSTLETIKEKVLTTRKITPAFSFASKGSVLPGRLSDGLPIITVNIPDVDIQFLRVRDTHVSQFLSSFRQKTGRAYYNINQFRHFTKSVYLGRFRTRARPNQRTVTHIPLRDIDELQKPGLYVAVMTRPGHFDYYYKTTFYVVTDIGLHARYYERDNNKLQVHARSLKTGKAMADVKIKMISAKGKLIEEAYTSSKGVARFKSRVPHRASLIAQKRNDTSMFSFRDPALDLSEFKIRGMKNIPVEPFVYTNRDLFRPGERVDFSILLRDQDGKAVTPVPLNLRIRQPDGRTMRKATLQVHSREQKGLGYYYFRYGIPANGQTGKWSLEVRTNPASKLPDRVFKFNVEEFLPERMKLDLVNKKKWLTPLQTFVVNATGAYLYGAPAAGNRVKAVLNRFPDFHPMADLKKFYFGDVNETKEKLRTELLDKKLDAKGKIDIQVKPLKTKYNSPMALMVTTSIFESGGRPVTRSIKRTVWPAKTLIGVRPLYSGKVADENSTVGFEVVKINKQGKKLPASNLEMKLIREDRNYYWSYSAGRGWHYRYTESQYPVVVQNVNIDKTGRAKISVPVEYGSYRLEITDPDTNLVMRHRFYAGWNWQARAQAKNARPDKVNMTLDKKAYRAGDTVRVKLIPPKGKGKAMVFVESDRMLAVREVYLPEKGKTVEFKIKKEWAQRHDVYITSVFFRPGDRREKITPNRAVGIVHLPFERAHRRLAVNVTIPKKMQPGRKLKVKVKVAGLKNQKAIVTVAATDLGILNITDFKTPDPVGHFFAKRSYSVDQYDLYGKVIENLAGTRARLRFGGDAAAGLKQSKRENAKVKTVALFSGPVDLDKNGEAVVALPVPDFNGSLRVMAVAFTEDRFGSTDKEIIVAAPVIAEIATPRFISPGDESSMTLDLHNLSGSKQNLAVKLTATSPLKLEPFVQTVSLDDKQKKVLRFKLIGGDGFAVGRINLEVKGDGVDLKRQWELGVRPAYPGERRVSYKLLKPGQTWKVGTKLINNMLPLATDGTMMISNTPPLNARSAVKGLLGYPYGCLEQTTSRAFPHVYIDANRATELGLKPFSLAKRAVMIQDAITRIRTMQKTNGSFGLWNNRSPEEPWLTPYVLDFLLEARSQGFTVPDDMLKKGLKNLLTRMGNRRRQISRYFYTRSIKHLRFAANAYAAYVLAKVQRGSLGTLRTLYDHHRNDAESGLPLIQLGIALHLRGDKKRGAEAIKLGLTKMPDTHVYLGDYGSPERDRGLAYALLARHKLLTGESDKLLFELGNRLKSREYLSTQDRLAIFLASHEAGKNSGDAWKASLVFDKRSLDLNQKGRFIKAFSYNTVKRGVSIKSHADKTLYLMFEVNGYPSVAPKPKSDKIEVTRTLYDMKGKRIKRRTFKVGELLVAHISVRGTQRTDNGLVVDLLPAGFEIENLNISKGENLDNLMIDGKKPKKVMASKMILHQEYRDDRFAAAIKISRWRTTDLFYLVRVVSPGTYNVPPVFAEDMYNPSQRGIGATMPKVTVVNVGK